MNAKALLYGNNKGGRVPNGDLEMQFVGLNIAAPH